MVKILDGKKAAETVLRGLKKRVGKKKIQLAIVQVGHRPDSDIYIRQKMRAAEHIGVRATLLALPSSVSQVTLIRRIEKLNHDRRVQGVLLQLPLPSHLDTHQIIETIDPAKDVDGFHSASRMTSPLILSLLKLVALAHPAKKITAVILGSSSVFSRSLSEHLGKQGYSVAQYSAERTIPSITKTADLVVTVRGRGPRLFARHLKKGVVVLDAGIRKFENHMTGDADSSCQKVAGAISPVPGGVGPLTVAYALSNLVLLANKKRG